VGIATTAAVAAACLYASGYPPALDAEVLPAPAELTFEKKRRKATSAEENRDLISSQHLQVRRSWENPGVYAWGSNSGRVVAPDSTDAVIKTPRRIAYFDGRLVRDMKLDRDFGVAVAENGDLLQWGTGFDPDFAEPIPTLTGKDIVKLTLSRDRIVALGRNGTVYSIPASRKDQQQGAKTRESTWLPFWSATSSISYRELKIDDLGWGERIHDVSSGLEHTLILTSKGRLFSAATGSEDFPCKGQLGIPGLTWTTRPTGSPDKPHEISTLRGFNIVRIAAGDYHSLAADDQGRVFSFGDNSAGQLGFEPSSDVPFVDAPSLINIPRLYAGTSMSPKVVNIAAGGQNSFFMIDATRIASQGAPIEASQAGLLGRVTADTWASGQGITGGLGNGRWTHVQGVPTKLKALSGLFEYDEVKSQTVPLRLASISVGTTHASAVMDNITHVAASARGTENETNWGADVLWWGGNEHYQLGTGRRNNVSNPIYIAPLDIEADKEKGRREEHRFQITPKKQMRHQGRSVEMEQRIECGRFVTAVYSGC
jgi:alpha-tubulin suppressor-like RCC1 family protein